LNLHALAQALLPLIGSGDEAGEIALAALEPYKAAYPRALIGRMSAKLGLAQSLAGDQALIDDLLRLMAANKTDFTIAFRRLADFSTQPGALNKAQRDLFIDRGGFDAWAMRYTERLRDEGSKDADRSARMRRVNPRVVLRNHMAEAAIRQAQTGDFAEVERLLKVLARPFDEAAVPSAQDIADADFPPEWAQTIEVSCSS